ncbi:MAG TPA: hypothetical protein VFR02_00290 [bacterium]|nr:hypothetical protein [bacterium]
MRKSDDELKIDITELFGGDLEPARQAAEQSLEEAAPAPPAGEAAPALEAAPAPPDQQYQEWISARERELETKTQELEKRLQDLLEQKLQAAQAAAPAPVPEAPPAEEAPASPAESPAPAGEGLAIDFSQPIRPPFLPDAVPPAPAEAALGSPVSDEEGLKRAQREYEFLLLYDEFRGIILHELRDLVGERKTFKMLERTVELAREKYPEIFRNANWDAAGNLLEDGSLDSQRLVENKASLDPAKANQVFDAGLGALLSLRLQAVEKGLGTGMKNKVRARLYQWINEKAERAAQAGKAVDDLNRLKAFVV